MFEEDIQVGNEKKEWSAETEQLRRGSHSLHRKKEVGFAAKKAHFQLESIKWNILYSSTVIPIENRSCFCKKTWFDDHISKKTIDKQR